MFLKNAFWNAAGNFVRQGALAVQEFGVRLLLPPLTVGIWELANLIRRVGSIWDLGFLSAAQRDLPAMRGLGQRDDEYAYRSTAFVSQTLSKIVVVAAIAGWTALRWRQYDGQHRMAIAAAAVMLLLTAVADTLTTFYQAAERYSPLSRMTMAASVIGAGVTLASTWQWGVSGLLISSVFGLALYAGLLAGSLRAAELTVRWKARGDLFRRMAGFALPLKAADYPLGVLGELDSLAVTRLLGLGPLAIYATGKMLVAQAVQATSWLALVLVVRINNLGIHDANRKQLGADIRRYLVVVDLVLLPVLIVGMWLVAPAVIARYLPAYTGSVRLLPFMLLTMYFVPQTTVVRNMWILDKRVRSVAVSNVVGLTAGVVSIGACVMIGGHELQMVAIGYLIAHIVYYAWIMATVGRETFGGRSALGIAGGAAGSCGYVAAVIALTQAAGPESISTFLSRAGGAIALLTPLVGFGLWRSKVVGYAAASWRARATVFGEVGQTVPAVPLETPGSRFE